MVKQTIFLVFAALILFSGGGQVTAAKGTTTQALYDPGPEYRHHCKPSNITDLSCR